MDAAPALSTSVAWDSATSTSPTEASRAGADARPLFGSLLSAFCGIGGYMQGLFRGCLSGVRAFLGMFRMLLVSETAQVELRSGRV
jgi:hypothetical protein